MYTTIIYFWCYLNDGLLLGCSYVLLKIGMIWMMVLRLLLLQAGPMISGLSVIAVSERIEVFQARLDTLMIKLERQASSERLFGLAVTEYPELEQIRHELKLLQRLYDLYNDVTSTIRGYFDIRWHDVDIEKISGELRDFQTRHGVVHFACLSITSRRHTHREQRNKNLRITAD